MKSLKMLLRFAIVGGLILLLLVPLMMIRGVINERSQYRDEAFTRVADSRAGRSSWWGRYGWCRGWNASRLNWLTRWASRRPRSR